MKNYLRFLSPVMLLLMAVMFGGGKILAQTAKLTFTAKCGGTGTDNQKGAWVISSDANESDYDKERGIHYGTKSKDVSYITATTEAYSTKKITKIIVNASAYETGSPKVSCTVGGASFGTEQALTNTNTPYTFEGTATGDIVVKISKNNTKKALYLKSIEVTYKEDDSKTQTTLSFGETYDGKTINVNLGDEFTAPTATLTPNIEGARIKYSSNKPTVATVDETTGAVTIVGIGTTVITANFAGDDTYGASTASYTINVVKPATVEDGVFDFTGDGTIDYGSGLKPREEFGSNEFLSATWVAGNVKVDMQKIRWMYSDVESYIRFYKSQKSNFTVTVPSGYFITNIRLGGAWSFVANCGSYNSKNGKWNGLSNSVTFDYNQSVNSKNINLTNIEVTYIKTETLTTSAGGYATYSADYAVNYSELGLTAYTLTVDETNKTVTAKAFTGVVPAGKAVLVKGDASKAYTLTPATTEGDATFATDLQTGATTADGTQYGFTTKFGTPAFAQVQSGQDIPAKKGYIVLNGASAAKYSICFGDEATGIHTIEAAPAANAAMFNLAGQRVDKAYKGIVIVNGKKYLNK